MVAGLVVGAQLSSRLLPRIGTKAAMAAGLTILAASLALFGTVSVHTGYGPAPFCLTLMGAGPGTAMTPGLDAIMGTMPEGELGAGRRSPARSARSAARSAWRCSATST
jgi:hypothetical protein